MILKFEEYVKESLWKKGIERSKSGEKRLEDKSPFDNYYKEIEWVDLGHPKYLFAKFDYPIEYPDDVQDNGSFYLSKHKVLLSPNEIIKINKELPNGELILNNSIMNWIKKKCVFKHVNVDNDKKSVLECQSPNGNKIYFDSLLSSSRYVLEIEPVSYYDIPRYRITEMEYSINSKSYFGSPINYLANNNQNDYKRFLIKLVKLKKVEK